jgi:hypothetical protein
MNRLEFATIDIRSAGDHRASRNLIHQNPLYIMMDVVGPRVQRMIKNQSAVRMDPYQYMWVRWKDWNPDSRDVVHENPNDTDYTLYVTYSLVNDDEWTRMPVYYNVVNGMKDTMAGTAFEFESYGIYTGDAVLKHYPGLRMVYSRGDAVMTPDQIKQGSGLSNYQKAERNWRHNPVHAMYEALKVAESRI